MPIANRIKEGIEALGLTIEQFAERIGDKPQRVKDVLRGKQRVPEDMLVAMVEIFHFDAQWLLIGVRTAPQAREQVGDYGGPRFRLSELDPLERRREKVKRLAEQLADQLDEDGLESVQVSLEKIERIRRLEEKVAELERKAG